MKQLHFLLTLFFFHPVPLHAQNPVHIYTVYFASDKANLDTTVKLSIDQFIATYKRSDEKGTLSLYGYADHEGTNSYNQQLSQKRVQSVAAYLEKQHISKKAIKRMEAYGEEGAAAKGSGALSLQETRRVDIVWRRASRAKEVKVDALHDSVDLFSLDTLEIGETVRLPQVDFYIASTKFTPQSQSALDQLLAIMKNHPTLVIEIQGHTCCPSKAEDGSHILVPTDLKLSESRARVVYDFLITHGISEARLQYKGFSNSVPLVYPERTEADRKLNRRVEIKVMAK